MLQSAGTPVFFEVSMILSDFPFAMVDWSTVDPVEHVGKEGTAFWRTCQFGVARVRMVEYSPGYSEGNWCWRGCIVLCLEGEFHTDLVDGRRYVLTPGMGYQVAAHIEGYRSFTVVGAKLFIVD